MKWLEENFWWIFLVVFVVCIGLAFPKPASADVPGLPSGLPETTATVGCG